MPRVVDPARMAQNWQSGMGSAQATANYKAGVQSVTTSPGALAATPDAIQRYLDGVNQSVASGRRQAALNAVSLQYWQNQAINKGAPRLATGAAAALPKFQSFSQKIAPLLTQISAHVAGMPKGGFANAVSRSSYAIQQMLAFAGKS
jgi:hypothetical protein